MPTDTTPPPDARDRSLTPPPAGSNLPVANNNQEAAAAAATDSAPWWVYIIIGVCMALLLLGVGALSRWSFESRAEKITSAYKLASNSNSSEANANPTYRDVNACAVVTDAERGKFILKQRQKVVELGDGHRRAAIEFGSYFFANIAILGVFGFISLISLLLITKRGITNAPGTLVAVFLLSSGVGLIYQGFFGVFQQKGNVDANHKQSVDYGRLVDEIDAYCATGKLAISSPADSFKTLVESERPADNSNTQKPPARTYFLALQPDDFILHVEWKIEELKGFAMALDEKPIQTFTTDPTRLSGFQ